MRARPGSRVVRTFSSHSSAFARISSGFTNHPQQLWASRGGGSPRLAVTCAPRTEWPRFGGAFFGHNLGRTKYPMRETYINIALVAPLSETVGNSCLGRP
jgi:hypothetical protein